MPYNKILSHRNDRNIETIDLLLLSSLLVSHSNHIIFLSPTRSTSTHTLQRYYVDSIYSFTDQDYNKEFNLSDYDFRSKSDDKFCLCKCSLIEKLEELGFVFSYSKMKGKEQKIGDKCFVRKKITQFDYLGETHFMSDLRGEEGYQLHFDLLNKIGKKKITLMSPLSYWKLSHNHPLFDLTSNIFLTNLGF